jgi:hypothetical protein
MARTITSALNREFSTMTPQELLTRAKGWLERHPEDEEGISPGHRRAVTKTVELLEKRDLELALTQ